MIDHNDCGANDDDYKVIENIWKPLGLNTTEDFKYGGYLVEDVIPGKIRTIHTNTLLFYKDNDAIKDDCDKEGSVGANHIKWIKQVLDDSRKLGYSVYILYVFKDCYYCVAHSLLSPIEHTFLQQAKRTSHTTHLHAQRSTLPY